jgi:hypothetical protein
LFDQWTHLVFVWFLIITCTFQCLFFSFCFVHFWFLLLSSTIPKSVSLRSFSPPPLRDREEEKKRPNNLSQYIMEINTYWQVKSSLQFTNPFRDLLFGFYQHFFFLWALTGKIKVLISFSLRFWSVMFCNGAKGSLNWGNVEWKIWFEFFCDWNCFDLQNSNKIG